MELFNKKKKAYTLTEVLVSLGVVAIVLTILVNALVNAVEISAKNLARSSLREEITAVSNLITQDIRNADYLNIDEGGCLDGTNFCELVVDGVTTRWEICNLDSICKFSSETGESVQVYQSSEDLEIETLIFDRGLTTETETALVDIMVTIVGSHSNDQLDINNLVRQFIVSTRNYNL